MSRDDAAWADGLLADVRQHADPSELDVARNLAGVEQRLQLGAPGPEAAERAGDGAAASAGTLLQLRPGGAPPAISPVISSGGALAGATSGGKSAAVLLRWLAFGAMGALIGYVGGREHSRQELAELQQTQQAQQMRQQLELEGTQRQLEQLQREREQQRQDQQRQRVAEQEHPLEPPKVVAVARRAEPRAPVPLRATPAHAPVAKERQPQNQQLREAIALLQRAEAALRQGDAFGASLLLSDLERTAPAHLLREERLATHALVGCALADEPSASAALRELEQLNPASIYRARLEGSCADKMRAPPPKVRPAPH